MLYRNVIKYQKYLKKASFSNTKTKSSEMFKALNKFIKFKNS